MSEKPKKVKATAGTFDKEGKYHATAVKEIKGKDVIDKSKNIEKNDERSK